MKTLFYIWRDICLLYKNFLHWNISKLIYYVYGLLVGIICALPFVLLFFIALWFSDVSITLLIEFFSGTGNGFEFIGAVLASPFSSLIAGLMLFLAAIATFVGMAYGEYFLYDLCLGYMKDKKLPYISKKRYINPVFFKKFFQINLWILAYVLIPIIVYLLIVGGSILGFGGVENMNNYIVENPDNLISRLLLLGFIGVGIVIAYLIFRSYFALLSFMELKKTSTTAYSYIKRSWKITSGGVKLVQCIGVFLCIGIIALPLQYVADGLKNDATNLNYYSELVIFQESFVSQDEFRASLESEYPNVVGDYTLLYTQYGDMTSDEISHRLSILDIMLKVYGVLYFLILYGVIQMVYTSFYIRVLKA